MRERYKLKYKIGWMSNAARLDHANLSYTESVS